MRYVALIVAAGLILTVTVTAGALTVTEYTYDGGTTQWTDTTSAVGSSSLQLGITGIFSDQRAGVDISNLGGLTVGGLDGWDYWTKSNSPFNPGFVPWDAYATAGVNLRLYLDTSEYGNIGGLDWDVRLDIMPHKMYDGCATPLIPADTWVNLESSTLTPYTLTAWTETSGYVGAVNLDTAWSDFQGLGSSSIGSRTYDFSDATITSARLFACAFGGNFRDVTAYLDDFTFDGTPVQLEGGITVIPEPLTMLAVFTGIAGLAGYVRKRRRV
ncbi:MAG: PEP-CTERM sorting domain-containing protein [Phycisphaerae bacterium]|nr:PEP-CTERM sorting domain-containing protein [Phycisphaerae bacterium]